MEVKITHPCENKMVAEFTFYLSSAPHRKIKKKMTFQQKFKSEKNRLDEELIEYFIKYLIQKKALTPELLFYENILHVRFMIIKNIKLIQKEDGDKMNRNKEVFREFIDGYANRKNGKKVSDFPTDVVPVIPDANAFIGGEGLGSYKVEDISIWPKGGLFVAPKEGDAGGDTGKSTLLLGASFSGKTYLLVRELNKLHPGDYDGIFLFTESPAAEPLKDLRADLKVKIYQGFDPTIVDFLKAVNDELSNKFRYLIILDDVVDQKLSKTLNKMVLTYRNSNISTCILIQYPNLISKSSRSSFHQVVLVGARSLEWWAVSCDVFDLKAWAKSQMQNPHQVSKISADQIYSFLKGVTKEPGVVIYLDQRKGLEPMIYKTK